jgi:hypothetical protein
MVFLAGKHQCLLYFLFTLKNLACHEHYQSPEVLFGTFEKNIES